MNLKPLLVILAVLAVALTGAAWVQPAPAGGCTIRNVPNDMRLRPPTTPPTTTTAAAATYASQERELQALTNQWRQANGLGALVWSEPLATGARQWSDRLAETGVISHDPNLRAALQGPYSRVGENVGHIGTASTMAVLDEAFRGSPTHFEHYQQPNYTHIGIGIRSDATSLWVTVRFGGTI